MKTRILFASILLLGAAPIPSWATPRAFVKSTGLDTNPCSLTAPCRTFVAALAVADAGGEVVVLDSAGYGPFTISQAVTITAPFGIYAGVTVPSGIGISVAAGVSDVVALRGLSITGVGGTTGISFTGGFALHVENSSITGFSDGVDLNASGGTHEAFLADTVIRDNSSHGVLVTGSVNASIERCRFENHPGAGAVVVNAGNTSVSRSVASGNVNGFVVGGSGTLSIAESTVSNNSGDAVEVNGTNASTTVQVSKSLITGNGTGFAQVVGTFDSRGDNFVNGNTTNTSGTITILSANQ